jgi:hypothetical protein
VLKPPVSPNPVITDYRAVYDESSALPRRSGLRFIGNQVTVTDDPSTDRTNVTVSDASVTVTGPFQYVDELSATPRAVTDWGALINTALGTGVRHFVFGGFDYPFTTKLNAAGIEGVTLEGYTTGYTWNDTGAGTDRTRLVWSGTGAGNFIDFTSIRNGPVIKNCEVLYSSGAYTGDLITFDFTANITIQDCRFGSVGDALTSARCALRCDQIVTMAVERCSFAAAFGAAVRGRESAGGTYSNVARFYECMFAGGTQAGIMNPGLDWMFDHCVFEFAESQPLASGKPMIGQDFAYGNVGDLSNLTLNDCAWWDAGLGTQFGVQTLADSYMNFSAINCMDHNASGNLAKLYDLKHNGTVVIKSGTFANPIDVGDGAVATQRKDQVQIEGVDDHSGGAATITGHNTGHKRVDVALKNYGVSTIAHERVIRVDQPSIAAHSGVTSHAFTIMAGDCAGAVLIQNNLGVTGPTGLLADITFANPPASPNTGAGVGAGNSFPLVEVFPFKPDDNNSNFLTPNMATTYTCQPYGYAKTLSFLGSQASFSIGVNVGIPAGGVIGIGYRVIHL